MFEKIAFSTLLLLWLSTGVSSANAEGLPDFAFLNVQAEAERLVPPDEAKISIRLLTFDEDSQTAVESLQTQIRVLLSVLSRFDIPESAITSFELGKTTERAFEERKETKILGYSITRRIEVELRDLSKFSELVAEITAIDNVMTFDAKFDVRDRENIEEELMYEAGRKALDVAQRMVSGLSVTVGEVHGISESSFRNYDAIYRLGGPNPGLYADMVGRSDQIFQPATIKLRQTLNVIFKLE